MVVSVAALLEKTHAVISGGNIDEQLFQKIISEEAVRVLRAKALLRLYHKTSDEWIIRKYVRDSDVVSCRSVNVKILPLFQSFRSFLLIL